MGKRKQKGLLADQGILHLNSCFVQPSEESGLLTTVGGMEQPLVLASGTYGYGIPMTVAIKAAESAQNKADEHQDPDVQIVREINGGVFSAQELSKDRSGVEVALNHEAMSVGELVRSIGGARDNPLRKCDVVEDRSAELINKDKDKHKAGEKSPKEDDPQAEEFYASLGIPNPNPNANAADNDNSENGAQMDVDVDVNSNACINANSNPNVTDGIRDFYKSYTQYYYSQDPNPFGDQRLQFSSRIQPGPMDEIENSNSNDGIGVDGEKTIIQLARMAQIRARQARVAAAALEKAKKAKALSSLSVEVTENEGDIYDPLPMEVVPSQTADELGITVDTTLDQYWEFVKDDPHDFNRWIYLIQYAESKNNIIICRKVYSAFLPLFSYCFGYWKRYSDMEKKFNYYGRALTILERGLEFIPLSVDLWKSYLALFCEINSHDPNYQQITREQYEKALNTCGMEFRSDSLWEEYIQWEFDNKRLKKAFSLYGRIMQVPTRLFNRHWDNFQALVRDHHPRDFLVKDEYEYMRKKGCKKLGLKYKEEPEYETGEIIKPSKPEDKLMDYVKEKILRKMTKVHAACELESEKRWVYEDRIRRPYFHTKPLDKYQLRNWEEYLNFEISLGDHDRIVLLFERCLIACALYETFWCKYARYLEHYHKQNPQELSIHFLKNQENLEIGSKKDTEEEESRVKDVQLVIDSILSQLEAEEREESLEISHVVQSIVNTVTLEELTERTERTEKTENEVVVYRLKSVITQVVGSGSSSSSCLDLPSLSDRFLALAEGYSDKVSAVGYIEATEELRTELLACTSYASRSPVLIGSACASSSGAVLPLSSGDQEYLDFDNDSGSEGSEGFSTLLSVPQFPPAKYLWQEAVRDVYKRACIIHCPKKPALRLQWAAFEEELGNSAQAVEVLRNVELWFPDHLEAKLFMIETQRRAKNYEEVSNLFEKYLSSSRRVPEYTMFTMKYARFLHKELQQPDKALRILRNGIKKDKGNLNLYSYVCDICYEKYPDDKKAPLAALELAISCKDFSEETKLIFLKRKLLFLQEHADIRRYRDTLDQVINLQELVRQRETEQLRKKEEEARLHVGTINPHLSAFPVPDRDLEALMQAQLAQTKKGQGEGQGGTPIPIEFEPVGEGDDAQFQVSKEVSWKPPEGEKDKKEKERERPFEKVAPPEELNLSNYGYASKHPDYKLAEYMAQKEYEQLESKGYPEDIKDTDQDKERASRKRKSEDPPTQLYIVHPKSATMYVSTSTATNTTTPQNSSSSTSTEKSAVLGAKGPEVIQLEAPQRLSSMAVPSTSPCINVPDWFIKEGGELCLSETKAGFSVLRYWPHFLNDMGQQKMFKAVRRSVKWHQKQRVVWGQWRYIPRLVSWLGPCDWADKGMELKKNEDWPPEVLDLLHRINQITQHEFNSCFLNLYRTGHDSHPWHGDIHPAYGANPPVATISLGSLRLFEMRRRGPTHNFVRFPLFPGSLLIMEGACQVDWSHQVPKDPKVEGERISIVFRVMHAIEVEEPVQLLLDSDNDKPEPSSNSTSVSASDHPEKEKSDPGEVKIGKKPSDKEKDGKVKVPQKSDKDKEKRKTDKDKDKDGKKMDSPLGNGADGKNSSSKDSKDKEREKVETVKVIEPQSQTRIRFHDRDREREKRGKSKSSTSSALINII